METHPTFLSMHFFISVRMEKIDKKKDKYKMLNEFWIEIVVEIETAIGNNSELTDTLYIPKWNSFNS